MAAYNESFEEAVSRLGAQNALEIAREVGNLLVKKGLSLSQADAVLEITKGLLTRVPFQCSAGKTNCDEKQANQ